MLAGAWPLSVQTASETAASEPFGWEDGWEDERRVASLRPSSARQSTGGGTSSTGGGTSSTGGGASSTGGGASSTGGGASSTGGGASSSRVSSSMLTCPNDEKRARPSPKSPLWHKPKPTRPTPSAQAGCKVQAEGGWRPSAPTWSRSKVGARGGAHMMTAFKSLAALQGGDNQL